MAWQDRTRAELRAALEHFAVGLASQPGVVALGVGRKIKGGKLIKGLSLRVYITKKKPMRNIRPHLRFPTLLQFQPRGRLRATKEIGIDLIEVGGPFEPCLTMGDSVSLASPHRYNDGTMGAILKDQLGQRYLLSNNHVLADVNFARIGQLVIHPSVAEGGSLPGSSIGKLHRFVPIFGVGNNFVDAAIARVAPSETTVIRGIGRVSGMVPTPAVGRQCMLFRKTIDQVVRGTVVDQEVTPTRITYQGGLGATFVRQILLSLPVDHGDSGALVVDANRRAFGLVMARNNGGFALACPLRLVLETLGSAATTKHAPTDLEDLKLEIA